MTGVPDTTAVAEPLATIPKLPYLFWAYVVIFVVIFVYLVSIHLRQRRLDREIASLSRRIESAPGPQRTETRR